MSNREIDLKIEEALKHADVDFVCLCFEAFQTDGKNILEPICSPLYSAPIANAKGLVVRFFEEDSSGNTLWEACIEGDQLELHHQYAVIFHTPPYKDKDLAKDRPVSMRLERRAQPFDWSESETFVYEPYRLNGPREEPIYKKESVLTSTKRPAMMDTSPSYCMPCKRRADNESFLSYSVSPDSLNPNQIIQDLLNMSTGELTALANLANNFDLDPNFFQMDFILEKDSPQEELLLNKLGLKKAFFLCYLIFKRRNQDVNNVTEQISKLNVLRPEDLTLRGAANTLLALKSGLLTKRKIMNLVIMGDENGLKEALEGDIDLEECDEFGNNALHKAVVAENEVILSLLLNDVTCFSWVDRPNKQGETPIVLGLKKGLIKVVELFLKTGVKLSEHEVMLKVCDILNNSGKWRQLAELWDLEFLIPIADNTDDPSKYLFDFLQAKQGLDWKILKNLLDAIQEKEAVEIIDSALIKNF